MKALLEMRAQLYADLADKMTKKTSLWLAAIENETNFSGVGGTYILMDHDKEVRRIRPTPNFYVYWKTTAHLLLEMTLLSLPYLNSTMPHVGIEQKVSNLKALIEQSLALISQDESLPSQTRSHLTSIFNLTRDYINKCIDTHKVTMENYQEFQSKLIGLIQENVRHASGIQVQQTMSALSELKKEYEDDWEHIHALITTIWPVTEESPREQVLKVLMDNHDHIHVIQNTPTMDELKQQLGRKLLDQSLQTPAEESSAESTSSSEVTRGTCPVTGAMGKCPMVDYRSEAVKEALDEDDTSVFITGQDISTVKVDTKAATNFYDSVVAINNQIRSDYLQTITKVSQNIPILFIDEEAMFKAPYEMKVVLFRPGQENQYFDPPEGANLLRASLAILDNVQMLLSPDSTHTLDADALQKLIDMSIELRKKIEQCRTIDDAAKENVKAYLDKVISRLQTKNMGELRQELAAVIKLVHSDMLRLYKNYFQEIYAKIDVPNFYTFIGAHSNTQTSISELAVREIMEPRKAITHVISAENIKSDGDAKITVTRILFDRAVAKLAFQQVPNYQVNLSTPIDLMADDTRHAVNLELAARERADKPMSKCPFDHSFFGKGQEGAAHPHTPRKADEPPGNEPPSGDKEPGL